jgi:hypothetical protein
LNSYMTTYSPNGPGVDQVFSEAEVTQFFDQGYVVLKGAANAQRSRLTGGLCSDCYPGT